MGLFSDLQGAPLVGRYLTMVMSLVIAAFAVVVFGMVFAKISRKQRDQEPLKTFIDSQPILYRTPVQVKLDTFAGWSTKTLAAMEITIRPGAISVSMTDKSIGETLGSDWSMLAPDTTIEVSRKPSHHLGNRQWIVLSAQELGKPLGLAVWSKGRLNDIWRALLDAGVTPLSGPPEPG